MANVPYHTHTFDIPTATEADAAAGVPGLLISADVFKPVVDGKIAVFDTYAEALGATLPVAVPTIVLRSRSNPADRGAATYDYWGTTPPEAPLWDQAIDGDIRGLKNWPTKPAGLISDGNWALCSNVSGLMTQTVTPVAFEENLVSFTVAGRTAGRVRIKLGAVVGEWRDANGTFTERMSVTDTVAAPGTFINRPLSLEFDGFSGKVNAISSRWLYKTKFAKLEITLQNGSKAYYLMAGRFNLRAMGAKGTKEDDSALILDAQYTGAAHKRYVYAPGGYSYAYSSGTVNNRPIENVMWEGDDETSVMHHNVVGKPWFQCSGSEEAVANASVVAAVVPAGTFYIPLAAGEAKNFKVGDYIKIWDPAFRITYNRDGSGNGCAQGEQHRVKAILPGDVLRLDGVTEFAYATTTMVGRIRYTAKYRYKNLKITSPTYNYTGLASYSLSLNFCRDILIDNVVFDGLDADPIRLTTCRDAWVVGSTFDHLRDELNVGGYGGAPANGCDNVHFWRCNFLKPRHSVTWNGGGTHVIESTHCSVRDNVVFWPTASGIDTHPVAVRHLEIAGNQIWGGDAADPRGGPGAGIQNRSRLVRMANNRIIGFGRGILDVCANSNLIEHNEISSCEVGIEIFSSPGTMARFNTLRDIRCQHIRIIKGTDFSSAMPRVSVLQNDLSGNPQGDYAGVTVTLTALPADGDSVTLKGRQYTFRTAPAGTQEVAIGTTTATASNNLALTVINDTFSVNEYYPLYDAGTNFVFFKSIIQGTGPNSWTITKSGAGITLQAATFINGGATACAIYWGNWEDGYRDSGNNIPDATTKRLGVAGMPASLAGSDDWKDSWTSAVVPGAKNRVKFTGGASGTAPTIEAVSDTDTNCPIILKGKNTDGVKLQGGNASTKIEVNNTGIGFFGATPVAKPGVSGSRGGNAALADLLTKLATLGILTDGTST